MITLVDVKDVAIGMDQMARELDAVVEDLGMKIRVQQKYFQDDLQGVADGRLAGRNL